MFTMGGCRAQPSLHGIRSAPHCPTNRTRVKCFDQCYLNTSWLRFVKCLSWAHVDAWCGQVSVRVERVDACDGEKTEDCGDVLLLHGGGACRFPAGFPWLEHSDWVCFRLTSVLGVITRAFLRLVFFLTGRVQCDLEDDAGWYAGKFENPEQPECGVALEKMKTSDGWGVGSRKFSIIARQIYQSWSKLKLSLSACCCRIVWCLRVRCSKLMVRTQWFLHSTVSWFALGTTRQKNRGRRPEAVLCSVIRPRGNLSRGGNCNFEKSQLVKSLLGTAAQNQMCKNVCEGSSRGRAQPMHLRPRGPHVGNVKPWSEMCFQVIWGGLRDLGWWAKSVRAKSKHL